MQNNILSVAAVVLAIAKPLMAAQIIASDNAANPAYVDGWQEGDNGGIGFGPWEFESLNTTGTFVTGSSATNGTPPSGNIDDTGISWQISGPGGFASAIARRPFASPMPVGSTIKFKIDMDDYCASTDRSMFHLMTGQYEFSMEFFGYYGFGTVDGSGQRSAGLAPAARMSDGVDVSITLVTQARYQMTLKISGQTYEYDRPLINSKPITGLMFWNQGYAWQPMFLNSMVLSIPEPSSMLWLTLVGLLSLRQRRIARA